MDELKSRAGEKFEALHVAAKTAAGNGKNKVEDVYQQTADAIQRVREAFLEIWQHEMIAEGRERVTAFARETVRRMKEGVPLLSPTHLYKELVALFKDRVWRRSMVIFALGAACGGVVGLALGVRAARGGGGGPHARALLAQPDQTVVLVEDALAPGAEVDEVLIRVQAFSVCPLDRAVLRGYAGSLRSLIRRTSLTVGRGFAGVVLDVGRDVMGLEMGDEVWGCVSEWGGGAASELLTIRSTRVSKRPTTLSANEAACLPWPASRALSAIEKLHVPEKPHTRIAICGASSAEGCLLVQLLAASGAHLTALAPRHALATLQDLGAQEAVELECANSKLAPASWSSVEALGARAGLWDAALACSGAPPRTPPPHSILKSTAPRSAVIDLRPRALLSDRLPGPFSLLFGVSFYSYRVLRWMVGKGSNTDWLEDRHHLTPALTELAKLVERGHLAPVLDKVYLPQDFESALAHACSDDAIGSTVIRFP